MVKRMAPQPLIMALANPTPEITPEEAVAARPDAMICTGRSDYPNQVNNVLCFPYIFRGALDVGATTINEAMKRAAVDAIAALAREAPSEVAARAYGGEARTFGKGSLIPNPFDPRLILRIAPAVAKAACESGVAAARSPTTRPTRSGSTASFPLRLHHEAGVHPGQGRAQARDLRRGRGRAHPARHPGRDRGGARFSAADRPARPSSRRGWSATASRSGRAATSS
jgi:hypothetical protein